MRHFGATTLRLAAACVILGWTSSLSAQLPFFPGAEGFGGAFAGSAPAGGWFSNATIYRVTNLNDSGPGSFRGAFQENSANKIIVFDVGGVINLTSDNIDIKNLSNYYIAGQTAPSPVTIYGDMTQLTHSSGKQNSNVVLRYLTFRKGTGDNDDAITFAGSGLGTNMILDHVSGSWSEDEVLSVANNNTNITIQYSIIADALVSNHAYGSLLRPRIDSNVTVHHNLYANNASRQARFGTYDGKLLTADFRNNVIYNWRDRASYAGGSSESAQEFADVNYVGNYLVAGPNTIGSATQVWGTDKNVTARLHQSGNYVDSDKSANPGGAPNGSLATNSQFIVSPPQTDQSLAFMPMPFLTPAATTQTAPDAFRQVIKHVGNFWWNREAIDQRIINNVKNNTGPPGGVGASAPNAAELAALLATPMTARPAGWDTDNDGMPNWWEEKHGLNPNSAADNRLDFDNDGYVNIIEYINEMGEFPAPAPIVFSGATNNRYAQITNWRTDDGGITTGSNWQPSKYDTAVIKTGTTTVDAIGQHAGTLKVAPATGDSAMVNVTAGWIDVNGAVEVGEAGAGQVNHSGGLVVAADVELGPTGSYHLSGTGMLRVGTLSRTANTGAFDFTGGTLVADVVDFDLINNGGTISPGASPGMMVVNGALTLNSGTLEIELGGTGPNQFDRVFANGALTLGGTLKVSTVDLGGGMFQPQLGDGFGILAGAGTGGMFASYDLPALAEGLQWALLPGDFTNFLTVVSSTANPADFNHDGQVNALDLAVLTTNFGATGQTNNNLGDANGDGDVDGADVLAWQANALISQSQAATGAVPEPATAALALGALALVRRRKRGA